MRRKHGQQGSRPGPDGRRKRTEEALFRGVFYEELKLSVGPWPARVIDSTAEIVVQLAAFGLIAEMAYDQGGLPESVALHARPSVA
jgi:hypothetical protein